jgi:hypothetical protein
MNPLKLGAVIIMIGLLVGFLLVMPTLISSASDAATEATSTGDAATASLLSIFPLITSIAGIGVAFMFVAAVIRR